MIVQFFYYKDLKNGKKTTAKQIRDVVAPWAAKVVRVTGGFRVYESVDDYNTSKKQI